MSTWRKAPSVETDHLVIWGVGGVVNNLVDSRVRNQICNWRFFKDQQRSITRKCNLLNLRQINMYLEGNSPNPEPETGWQLVVPLRLALCRFGSCSPVFVSTWTQVDPSFKIQGSLRRRFAKLTCPVCAHSSSSVLLDLAPSHLRRVT